MPEGPEVRVLVDGLRRLLLHGDESLHLAEVIQESPLKTISLDSLMKMPLEDIWCHGKLIIFSFGENFLLSSLGMTGGWSLEEKAHRRLSLVFSTLGGEETTLHYCDARRFGKICGVSRRELDLKLSKRGPDPFSRDFSLRDVYRLHKTRRCIAVALLDQSLLVGIGNYLKSDILWAARIDPRRSACDLLPEEMERLFYHIVDVMNSSYVSGGYSMRDYFHLDGSKGHYRPLIYGRDEVNGERVTRFILKGRVTYMVNDLQR